LTIWWNQGKYKAEDDAVKKLADAWSQQTGVQVDLSFYGSSAILTKTKSAVTAGEAPDIVYAERLNAPLYAWNGKLADISDVISSIDLVQSAQTASMQYNSKAGSVSHYMLPVDRQSEMIFYWK